MADYVDVTVDGSASRIVTAVPEGEGPFPGVLITIHGGGLDKFEEDLADKLAAEGYIAAAPDIFHRQEWTDDAALRRSRLRDNEILADIQAGLDWIEGTGKADMGRLAILGHCMGGRAALLGASVKPVYKAAVVYYGGNVFVPWGDGPAPFERLTGLKCPVIGFYGNDDQNPSPEDVDKIDAELDRLDIDHSFYRYDGAGHAFQNFLSDSQYRKEATEDSWAKTLRFLKETV